MPIGRRAALPLLTLAALGAPALIRRAAAQDFAPGRPITLIVPTSAGGTTDFAARLLAEPLGQRLGRPVVVDNRAGANGVIGAQAVARARPDGHTLLVQYSGYHVGTPALVQNLGWNPRTDLAPVALLMDAPQVLLEHPSVPAKTLAELVAYAKANPGKLNYASAGNGSMQHLGTELLKQRAGIDLVHVPYKGTGPAMQDLLSGRVPLFLTTPPPAIPFIQSGQLRALVLAARERHPALPDVPTAAEEGLPGFTAEAWFAVFAPARTPEALVGRLATEISAITATPEFRAKAEEQGAVVRPMTPSQLGDRVARELAEWAEVVSAGNITAE
ncbi:Bug family tripartite tricarboxylate transporter substrate binding protein [Pseudoroseomonas ludipueritiae]|uniref:Tripartite tricarboxylate transporter substrate binding protein n=1 Tax=Pseudoroseomonas ludipueritiae TaxID=198093 RepID=A0ABR7RCC3_9PROT|nr:tripartite tricarboxylate transporter substrate binding protein [Pseudoroseomonas ludipueritiae]MBC9179147.1 tripartite tricarboxylate transporter substrate binding protein [Pseudoroseomonas ludipueritiae]